MATGVMSGVIAQLRRAALVRDRDELSDGQLLEYFLLDRDEAAFEALVRRHAPMVLGVCRRVLGHCHDAEDAFQAAFLVLVRKAASIQPRELVGNWLYGVAQRTALKAKAMAARRRAREKQMVAMPVQEAHDAEVWRDLRPVIDQELQRLSDHYRAAVVLCDLEGKSRRAAARQLGWPEGTLSTRLTRGRKILAKRLTRRGLALSAGSLVLTLSNKAVSACVPAPLLVSTVKTASLVAAGEAAAIAAPVAALTEGVLQAMFLTKVKSAITVLVVVAFLGTGAGLLGHKGLARDAVAKQQTSQVKDTLKPDAVAPPVSLAGERDRDEEGLVTVALAQRTQAPARQAQATEIHGMVKAVDAGARTITVAIGGGRDASPEEKTFALAKDVEVAVGSSVGRGTGGLLKEAKLADLAAGIKVMLSLAADEKQVEAIVAVGPVVRGQLKSVDAGKKTITISEPRRRDAEGEEKTYAVAANAEIAIDDGRGRRFSIKEAGLADLAAGAVVTAQLSLDGKRVQAVLAEGPGFAGTIKALDPAKKNLALVIRQPRGDDAGEEQVLNVSDDALILIDDGKGRRLSLKQRKLADLPVGAAVTGKMSVDQSLVMSLRAEGPTITGLLKGVDPKQRQITIGIPKGRNDFEEKTFAVAKDVRIKLDSGAANLDSLKVSENGPPVQLRLTLDQKAVQAISARQTFGR